MIYVLKYWNTYTEREKKEAYAMLFKMCTCTKDNKKNRKIMRKPTSNRPRTTRQNKHTNVSLTLPIAPHSPIQTKVKIHKTSSRILKTSSHTIAIEVEHKSHIFLKRVFTRTRKQSLLISEQKQTRKNERKKSHKNTWTTTETRKRECKRAWKFIY